MPAFNWLPGQYRHSQARRAFAQPGFFNVRQFPLIGFIGTAVKVVKGALTLHGTTKSITMKPVGGKTAQFPPGTQRTGFATVRALKRTNYGIDRFVGPAGDEVRIDISSGGTKK